MTYLARNGRRRNGVGLGGDGSIIDEFFSELFSPPAQSAQAADPSDNVTQTAGGGVTTSIADFTSVGGVCKPKNFPALNAVREFQRQLNRVAQVKGYGKTAVDGAVGPATLALFRQVQSAAGGSVMGDPSSCMGVAPDVDVLAAQIKAFADGLGAPPQVAGPISLAAPTIVTASGKKIVSPDAGLTGSLATLDPTMKVALLAVTGGIGYLLFTKKKRRK